jgi:hypothetical protein
VYAPTPEPEIDRPAAAGVRPTMGGAERPAAGEAERPPATGEAERPATEEWSRSGPGRWVYFALGWTFFALGMIGLLLPVVPTTPFLILALWAFSRSSRRFHDWLYHHPIFGPRLQAWHRARVIPLPVKVTAWGGMTCSLALMVWVRAPWPAILAAAIVMTIGGFFIGSCPSRDPQ